MRTYLPLGIVFVLVGLATIFAPTGFIRAVVVSVGVASVASGAFALVKTRGLVESVAFRRALTVRALISLAVGVTAIFLPLLFAGAVWVAVTSALAFSLLASAAVGAYAAFAMRRSGMSVTPPLVEASVSVVVALVLFLFPGQTGIVFVRVCGVLILLAGGALVAAGLGAFPAKEA